MMPMNNSNNNKDCLYIESIANGPRSGSGNNRGQCVAAEQRQKQKRVSWGGRDGRRKGGPFKPARTVWVIMYLAF